MQGAFDPGSSVHRLGADVMQMIARQVPFEPGEAFRELGFMIRDPTLPAELRWGGVEFGVQRVFFTVTSLVSGGSAEVSSAEGFRALVVELGGAAPVVFRAPLQKAEVVALFGQLLDFVLHPVHAVEAFRALKARAVAAARRLNLEVEDRGERFALDEPGTKRRLLLLEVRGDEVRVSLDGGVEPWRKRLSRGFLDELKGRIDALV